MSADRRLALALAWIGVLACGPSPAAETKAETSVEANVETSVGAGASERIDVHVHLVDGQRDALLAALDRRGIAAAVVIASPHLDVRSGVTLDESGLLRGWQAANDRLLDETAGHRDRLLPFITVEPAEVEIAELEAWFARGACGVKLYFGHQRLHPRPLDDARHARLFAWLEAERVPVLAHVNTVRYRDELASLLRAYPELELVCPHLCGSRTEVARLEALLREFPRLRVDTSHGGGVHGAEGFAAIEREHERVRALIEAAPERFLFGSDLVTTPSPLGASATIREWDLQLDANLGLLEAERFTSWREQAAGGMVLGEYRGLALAAGVRSQVLAGNARTWLSRCLDAP